MPYAIIRTGGKQYRVSEGDRLRIEKISAQVGEEVALSDVLALGEGADLTLDAAQLTGQSVRAKVLRHGRGKKIHIWKFKRRKGIDRRMGHRQDFTEVQIVALPSGGA
jgi:large subunit ribosomal protein L21